MVALKLILQSLAAVVAVGGAVGGTVALSNNKTTTQKEVQEEKKQQQAETLTFPNSEYNRSSVSIPLERQQRTKITEVDLNSTNQTSKVFYLVSPAIAIADSAPKQELFDSENLTNKNYQCINTSQPSQEEKIITKDLSCILYSLKKTSNTPLKKSEIKTWTQNKTISLATKAIKKSEIKYQKFFLLEAHNNLIEFGINNRQQIIYLTKTKTTNFFEQENYYVMLQVHAKISANEVTGATDTIIAKATAEQQTTNNTGNNSSASYKCSFKLEDPKTDCTISKLSQYTTPTNSFNFESETIKNKSEATNIETESYYFIKADEIIRHEIQNLKSSTAKYIETNSENSTTTTTLSVEAPVFAKFNNDETRLSELIILD